MIGRIGCRARAHGGIWMCRVRVVCREWAPSRASWVLRLILTPAVTRSILQPGVTKSLGKNYWHYRGCSGGPEVFFFWDNKRA
jgi:hypothetical protein